MNGLTAILVLQLGVKDITITKALVKTLNKELNFGSIEMKNDNDMKHYSTIFLILALITGLIGFVGDGFEGVEIVRILSLIFTDLFVISLIAKAFFPDKKIRFERIQK